MVWEERLGMKGLGGVKLRLGLRSRLCTGGEGDGEDLCLGDWGLFGDFLSDFGELPRSKFEHFNLKW